PRKRAATDHRQQRREKEAAQHGQDDNGESSRFRAPPLRERRRSQRRQRQQHRRRDNEFEEIHTPPIGRLREEHRQRAVRILLSDGLRAYRERSDYVGKQPEVQVALSPHQRGG